MENIEISEEQYETLRVALAKENTEQFLARFLQFKQGVHQEDLKRANFDRFTVENMNRIVLLQQVELSNPQNIRKGDWVYNKLSKSVEQVNGVFEDIGTNNLLAKLNTPSVEILRIRDLRLCTPKEYQHEQRKKYWHENGRAIWELKGGDVIKNKSTGENFNVITSNNDETELRNGNNEIMVNKPPLEMEKEYKVVVFSDKREDF